MQELVVPMHVLPQEQADAMLRHLVRFEPVAAAGFDDRLVLRVLHDGTVTRAEVLEMLREMVAPRGA